VNTPLRRTFILLLLATFVAGLSGDAFAKSCGPPRRAKPQRRKGGESFPPLPLPATPLRRTEKKRPPAPPALVGKVQYGKIVWVTDKKTGRRTSYRDWTTDPADIQNIVRQTNRALGIRYRPVYTTFSGFSYNPAEIPILYLTGHEAFTLTDEQRKKLFFFVNDGGYVLGDACCGSEEFFKSFVSEMRKTFPNKPLHLLDPDHPIFNCHYKIDTVRARVEAKYVNGVRPPIYGINFGCRTAVFAWPYDLSCGWDGHTHEHGKRIDVPDARRLGVNIMCYALTNYQLGRFLSTQRTYYQAGEHTRDEFVFAQVVHNGDWDPTPNGVMNFLRYARANSTLPVQYKRKEISLSDPEVLRYPILFMTGHMDFTLSDAEAAGLRNYLRNGGILLANACCGRQAFDTAFRREIAKALPEGVALEPVPLNHPVYTAQAPIRTVAYSPMLLARHKDLAVPTLEGVTINGHLAVIYSRFGLSSEWDGQERPYGLCYESDDGLRLGLNIVVYAMTH